MAKLAFTFHASASTHGVAVCVYAGTGTVLQLAGEDACVTRMRAKHIRVVSERSRRTETSMAKNVTVSKRS